MNLEKKLLKLLSSARSQDIRLIYKNHVTFLGIIIPLFYCIVNDYIVFTNTLDDFQ